LPIGIIALRHGGGVLSFVTLPLPITVLAPIRQTSFAREWCIAFGHRRQPERIFVILTAYLDESGTHGDSPVTVVGGMLANAQQWEAFEKAFRKIKRKHGFQIFHTKKFKKRDGDFKGWSHPQQVALMVDLVPITATAFTEGVTVTLDNKDYEAEYKTGDKPKRLRLDSKYGLCFRNCLLFFALEAMKRVYRGRLPTLHFVLEAGHKNAGDALRIFNETKAELETKGFYMLGDILFADKDKSDPLMMADFLAHTAFLMGNEGGRAPDHWPAAMDLKHPPLKRGESGVTHLRFKPGGLIELKDVLIEGLKAKGASAKRSPSQEQSS
jgi:hypothetical protein